MSPVPSPGKRVRVSHDWFWFHFWLVEKVTREFFNQSQSVAMQNQSNCGITFDTYSGHPFNITEVKNATNEPRMTDHGANVRSSSLWSAIMRNSKDMICKSMKWRSFIVIFSFVLVRSLMVNTVSAATWIVPRILIPGYCVAVRDKKSQLDPELQNWKKN